MTPKPTPRDRRLMVDIAEHRVLTVVQIASLAGRNPRSVHRRVLELERFGLIHGATCGFRGRRGRPEKLVSLAPSGVEVLRDAGILRRDTPDDRVTASRIRCVEHQLLVNWLRIQLARVEQIVPGLKVRFLSPNSPFVARTPDDRPAVSDWIPAERPRRSRTWFTPDGVFSIHDAQQDRAVLFFVEVDMGTEALASPGHGRSDLRSKILTYQTYWRTRRYGRYEQTWSCKLRGYRLLFITHSADRMVAVCRLVRDLPATDFVWITDRVHVENEGVWSRIWARGGRSDAPLESILGTRTPEPGPRPALRAGLGCP